jgi:ribosomal protein L29
LDKANAEAARYRKDLRATQGELETLKARLAELEGQGKSEADKLVDLKAKAEQERDQALADLKAERINNTVIAAAAKLKLTNPGLAPRLIDQTALEFDENGYPTNAEAVVQTLIQAEPYLVGATVPATQQATPATGQPNNGNGKALSMDDVAKMSETEINANWDAVQAALAAERARRRAGVA